MSNNKVRKCIKCKKIIVGDSKFLCHDCVNQVRNVGSIVLGVAGSVALGLWKNKDKIIKH